MRARLHACLELTKPGITLFIGVSAAAGFLLAEGGWARPGTLALALLATMSMSGGAAALNQLVERDADARMRRTARRPLPAGILTPRQAGAFGWGLSLAGLVLSLALLPWATTLFLVLSHLSYVYLYTPLKRRTPLCTLAGAIPGALPAIAGWAATGRPLDAACVALGALLFTWQIPHFMAIGWLAREDYAKAGFRTLPVVDPSGRSSARVSLRYAALMLGSAAVLAATASTGIVYAVAAAGVGPAYVALAWAFVRRPVRDEARRLFLGSLLVLPLLLAGLAVDLLLPAPVGSRRAVAAERPAPGRAPAGPASAAMPEGGHRFRAAARNAP